MKRRIAALAVVAGLMSLLLVAPVAAAPPTANQTQGAAGLVNALVGLNGVLNQDQVGLVNVGHSLNNLTALNNVLNNSPILSGNNVLNGSPILNNNNVLQDILNGSLNNNNVLNAVQIAALNDFLNNNNIAVGQVLGVAVLNGGGIAVIV
jgi:hypothetical protein